MLERNGVVCLEERQTALVLRARSSAPIAQALGEK